MSEPASYSRELQASALGSFSLLARAALVDGALASPELQLLSAFAQRVGLPLAEAQERLDHLRQGAGLRIRPPQNVEEARERLADVAAMIASDGFLDPAELALLEKIATIFKLSAADAHQVLEQMPQGLGMPPRPDLSQSQRREWHVPQGTPHLRARISPLALIVGLGVLIWGLVQGGDGALCLVPLGGLLLALGIFFVWYAGPVLRRWLRDGRLCRAFIHSCAWHDLDGIEEMGARSGKLELGLLDGGLRQVEACYPDLTALPQPGRCVWAVIHPTDPQRVLIHKAGLHETRSERRIADTPLR